MYKFTSMTIYHIAPLVPLHFLSFMKAT